MNDEWATPEPFYKGLIEEFGKFDLDPCCSIPSFSKGKSFMTPEMNGLKEKWYGNVFCNPPFSDLSTWTNKIIDEYQNNEDVKQIILLIPGNKTEQKFYHRLLRYVDELYHVKGRLNYVPMTNVKTSSPRFPSVVLRFNKNPYNHYFKFSCDIKDITIGILNRSNGRIIGNWGITNDD